MNLVDSSGWLEYFSGGPNAGFFAPAIEDTSNLLVSPINVYEVFKRILQQRNENEAILAVAAMFQARMIEVDAPISVTAAKLSLEFGIPMTDSLILATARMMNATLWTQDHDFFGITGIKFIKMKKRQIDKE